MNFNMTEEQKMLVETIRTMAERAEPSRCSGSPRPVSSSGGSSTSGGAVDKSIRQGR